MPIWSNTHSSDTPLAQRVQAWHFASYGVPAEAVATAPATWSLIGEHTDHAGGIVLMSIADLHAAVSISPRRDNTVNIHEYQLTASGDWAETTSSAPLPHNQDANATNTSNRATQLAGLATTMIQRQMLSRDAKGFDITIGTEIPPLSGLGEIEAIEVATALALAHAIDDIDTPPAKTKLADICYQAAQLYRTEPALRARYTVALRGKDGMINVVDYADFSITQASHIVGNLNKTAAIAVIPPVSDFEPASEELKRRQAFVDEATRAFGAESIRLLPEANIRVIDWLRACHEVHGTDNLPTISEANQWMDYHCDELHTVQTVTQAIRSRRIADVYPALAQSQHNMAGLYGVTSIDDKIAQLCITRGADSARSAHSGLSPAVIALVKSTRAGNFIADLSDDGFTIVELTNGTPATLLQV